MNRRIHSTGSSSILEVPQKLPHSRSKACIKKQSVSKSNLSSRPCRRMPLQPDGGARGVNQRATSEPSTQGVVKQKVLNQ